MNREETLSWIKTLTDKQFAELFYDAVSERNTSETDITMGHFVLADVLTWEDDEIGIEFVGLNFHSDDVYENDYPICQSGTCQNCRNKIRSWAKHILCPICGVEAYGT